MAVDSEIAVTSCADVEAVAVCVDADCSALTGHSKTATPETDCSQNPARTG